MSEESQDGAHTDPQSTSLLPELRSAKLNVHSLGLHRKAAVLAGRRMQAGLCEKSHPSKDKHYAERKTEFFPITGRWHCNKYGIGEVFVYPSAEPVSFRLPPAENLQVFYARRFPTEPKSYPSQ